MAKKYEIVSPSDREQVLLIELNHRVKNSLQTVSSVLRLQPVLGDAIRYTLSPLLARIMWPLLTRKIFGPASVPEKFEDGFPKEMTFRPSQIRASAAESALMIPGAFAARGHYAELKMPVVILAGEEDRLIDIDEQSARLHSELPNSTIHRVRGAGHMVHQTAPEAAMAAIEQAALADAAGPANVIPLAA
jgi:pimeloyl-ACP methyl ester carboxylesterase